MTASSAASPFTRATKVIAVADVVESVRLMEQGEQAFIVRWHEFVDFAEEHVVLHTGRLHKSLGDGLMLEFAEPAGCVRAALAFQAWFQDLNGTLPPEEQMHLRVGAHVADFVADKYDIYGTGVNVTARIATLAGPGEVVISAALRERLDQSLPLQLHDLGRCHLKHVKQPVHAFRIIPPGERPVLPAQPIDANGLRATVAVLPAGGRTSPSEEGHDTVVDGLVTALARSDALQVVSRMTALAANPDRGSHTVLSQIGARYVLTGRGRSLPDGRAFYAELADAESGHVIWAESFAAVPGAPALVDSHLRSQVLGAVHGAVIQHEMESAATRALPCLEGSTLLLAAMGFMHRLSPMDIEQASGLLEHLLYRWRRHPTAHAWLAHLHVLRLQQAAAGFAREEAALAHAHASAAVQADPGSALVLALAGHAHLHGLRNVEAANERYSQALSARPQHSLAQLFRAELLALCGSGRAARVLAARARAALALEPLRYLYDAIAALAALADDDAPAAAQLAQQSLHRNPRCISTWRMLVVALVESERLGEARAAQQQLLRRQPAFTVRRFVGSMAMDSQLEGRFAEGLRKAGVPLD